ncbi:MAG: HAMP domain-containing histidine kinase [Odoribacteraceae bacterium]|jgi:two-component system phosphate regulon sensor histidine kinase PhoR|nr:HAMP domain-containing histidine kinase [Odoribacteraceae bacterium]
MRKQQIIILGVILGLSFTGLVLLQASYFQRTLEVRRQQFAFTVYKAMDEVIEYIREIKQDARGVEGNKWVVQEDGDINTYLSDSKDFVYNEEERESRFIGYKGKEDNLKASLAKLQQAIKEQLGKEYNIVFEKQEAPGQRLKSVIHADELQRVIRERLQENHLSSGCEFAIKEGGDFVITSSLFNRYPEKYAFHKKVFPGEGESSPVLYLKFPDQSRETESSIMMWLPSVVIIFILLACAVFCIVIIIRQKRLSTIKNDFINNMTHEFKTPLATISLASQMLKDGAVTHTPEATERVASIIWDESKRLTYQIERVLQTALFTESRVRLRLKNVKVNDIIKDFLPRLSLRVEGNGGKLSSSFQAGQDEVMADEVHVTNVLSNLVDNAIKYTVRVPEIAIRTSSNDREITISVIDNGIGIAKKDQKLIFERFYRVSTGNLHDVKGFGLGLSYVKKIIEAHGGRVEVESTPDNGSRFDVILPLNKKKEKVKRTLFF